MSQGPWVVGPRRLPGVSRIVLVAVSKALGQQPAVFPPSACDLTHSRAIPGPDGASFCDCFIVNSTHRYAGSTCQKLVTKTLRVAVSVLAYGPPKYLEQTAGLIESFDKQSSGSQFDVIVFYGPADSFSSDHPTLKNLRNLLGDR